MTDRNDLPQAVPAGADPSGEKTPEALSREANSRVVAERQAIDRALVNKTLPIALREGLLAGLAKEIVEFNRRAADFTVRQEALAESRVNLPMELTDPKYCAADLTKRAAKVRGERYDALRTHAKLLAARKPLLETLIRHIDKDCRAAESRVQDATAKVTKGFMDIGYVAHPARGGRQGQYPEAEKHAFDYAVRTQPAVQEAEAAAKQIRADLAEIRRQAAGVDSDVAYMDDRAADLWRQLVGDGT